MTNQGQPPYIIPASTIPPTNEALRRAFIATSLRKSMKLDPIVNPVAGQTYSVKFPGTGIARYLRLMVTANVTITVPSGTATVSPKFPYNLFQRIVLSDPATNYRINTDGYQLYKLKLFKDLAGGSQNYSHTQFAGVANSGTLPNQAATSFTDGYAVLSTETFNAPSVGSVGGTSNLVTFWIDVPWELSPLDTRGVANLESATANAYCLLTINPSIGGANSDSPVIVTGAATAALTSMTITPVYYFYSPVYLDNGKGGLSVALPVNDMVVMHEIMTQRMTALNTGTDNRLTLVSGRTYWRVWADLVGNGKLINGTVNGAGTAGATDVKFLYNAAIPTMQENLQAYLSRTRDDYNADMPPGNFLWDLSSRPWDASHYGQLDAVLTLDSAYSTTAPSYVDLTREALYYAPIAQ